MYSLQGGCPVYVHCEIIVILFSLYDTRHPAAVSHITIEILSQSLPFFNPFLTNGKNERYNILLQNENGPCPLLAAANVLLLKKSIALPSNCIGSGVVTIEELTNILAEKMLTNNHGENGSDHHINETLRIFPNLQFGMDVNVSDSG